HLFEREWLRVALADELGGAHVGKQKSARGGLAYDSVAMSHLRVDDPGTLTTHAKRQPVVFRSPCQGAIDSSNIGMAASHGGDQHWISQCMAQEMYPGIDGVQV